jgi:hypothetical protein
LDRIEVLGLGGRLVLHRGIFIAGALAGLLLVCTTTIADGLAVWVVPSLQRVGLDDPAEPDSLASLQAARGEYESFQIAIKAPEAGGLTHVNVSVSDLSGSGGYVIGQSNITLYREKYVHVSTGSPDRGGANRPSGTGWYPDALIPFADPKTGRPLSGAALTAAPFDVERGKNQPIWVDVFVPRDAAAGVYQGTFTITCDQGNFTGPVKLEVWNFTLPLRPSLKSSFLLWSATDPASVQELLRHKLSPAKTLPSDERGLIDGFGLTSGDLGFWSGADISHCSMQPAPPVDLLRQAVATHAPDLFLYNYTADEIDRCPALSAQLKQWARNLHQAGVSNLVTMAPRADLLDDGSGTGRSVVDIWALLPVLYDRNVTAILAAQQKGDDVWSYNSLVQDSYSPKWLIDFSPINLRIQPGFINQSLGLKGLLYWRVDLWSADPWNEANSSQFPQYPGEGLLVYPGKMVGIEGVAPSMRLKWLRDGVEDYEYIELLKEAGAGAWALQVAAEVGGSWGLWTRDPQQLETARRRLGMELSRADRRRSDPPTPGPEGRRTR